MTKFKLLDQTSNAKDPQWLITISDYSYSIGRGFCIIPQWEDLKPKQSKADAETILRALQSYDDLLVALKIALPYVESFDDDNADLQTKANAETVRAAIARATKSEVEK